jgi:transcriptional regulator with XRE-family HTH domain
LPKARLDRLVLAACPADREASCPLGGGGEATTMPPRSPTVRRRRLGIELRRLRDEAGLTIDRVAEALECSDSKISRIETGQVSATPRDVRDMLQIYGVDEQQRDELVQMAREARQKGWWHAFGDIPVPAIVGFESAASSMSHYAALTIPFLFQTPDYARTVLHAIRGDLPPEELERRVELRMARQSLLTQDEPPHFWVVLDEAALRRRVGGSETTRTQLERLEEVATLPKVTLQILPFTSGEHAGLDGGFTIIGFAEQADPNLVFIEHTTSDLYVEDAAAVRQYDRLFNHLRASALAPADSIQFLTAVGKDLSSS